MKSLIGLDVTDVGIATSDGGIATSVGKFPETYMNILKQKEQFPKITHVVSWKSRT